MMTKAKRASFREFATFFKVSEKTVEAWKKKYEAEEKPYDSRNIQSVFEFFVYAIFRKYKIDFFKHLLKGRV